MNRNIFEKNSRKEYLKGIEKGKKIVCKYLNNNLNTNKQDILVDIINEFKKILKENKMTIIDLYRVYIKRNLIIINLNGKCKIPKIAQIQRGIK